MEDIIIKNTKLCIQYVSTWVADPFPQRRYELRKQIWLHWRRKLGWNRYHAVQRSWIRLTSLGTGQRGVRSSRQCLNLLWRQNFLSCLHGQRGQHVNDHDGDNCEQQRCRRMEYSIRGCPGLGFSPSRVGLSVVRRRLRLEAAALDRTERHLL